MDVFKEYGNYYDLLYADKDYRGEAIQVNKILREYGVRAGGRLLDIGCGSGKHDIELARLGYSITGIDQSESMIGCARKRLSQNGWNGGVEFVRCDVRKFNIDDNFDAAISLFHVVSYINSNDDLITAFKSIRKCLDRGAIFLFSTWYGAGVLTDLPTIRLKEIENDDIVVKRIAEPQIYNKECVVQVNYKIFVIDKKTQLMKEFRERHCMRYFFAPEMELMLELSGFRLTRIADERSLSDVSFSSWTCYFIAEAV